MKLPNKRKLDGITIYPFMLVLGYVYGALVGWLFSLIFGWEAGSILQPIFMVLFAFAMPILFFVESRKVRNRQHVASESESLPMPDHFTDIE